LLGGEPVVSDNIPTTDKTCAKDDRGRDGELPTTSKYVVVRYRVLFLYTTIISIVLVIFTGIDYILPSLDDQNCSLKQETATKIV
jgi:hypothetical protein